MNLGGEERHHNIKLPSGYSHGGDRKSKPQNAVLKQEEIAIQLGISVDTLQRLKKLQTLTPELQELIEIGKITPSIGYNVLVKLSTEEQIQLVEKLGVEVLTKLNKNQVQELGSLIFSVDYC